MFGKLANRYKKQGKRVLLCAADTFRAAAADQLEIWADRAGVEIVRSREGADPGAVLFDSLQAAKARNVDVVFCDTAGRLHNKANLMQELSKLRKIIDRETPDAAKETLLVLDATTGQNGLQQAKVFRETAGLTGIILKKLDGTAKGGICVAIAQELGVPVKVLADPDGEDDRSLYHGIAGAVRVKHPGPEEDMQQGAQIVILLAVQRRDLLHVDARFRNQLARAFDHRTTPVLGLLFVPSDARKGRLVFDKRRRYARPVDVEKGRFVAACAKVEGQDFFAHYVILALQVPSRSKGQI